MDRWTIKVRQHCNPITSRIISHKPTDEERDAFIRATMLRCGFTEAEANHPESCHFDCWVTKESLVDGHMIETYVPREARAQ